MSLRRGASVGAANAAFGLNVGARCRGVVRRVFSLQYLTEGRFGSEPASSDLRKFPKKGRAG
jgi:hypothetical protein